MKRFITSILWTIFIALPFAIMMVSCDDNEPNSNKNNEPDTPPVEQPQDDFTAYIDSCLKISDNPDLLADIISKHDDVISAKTDEDGIILTLNDGREFCVATSIAKSEPDFAPEDSIKMSILLDSISSAYSIPLQDENRNLNKYISSNNNPITSRGSNIAPRILKKYEVLLFSPDPNLRPQDVYRFKNAIRRQSGYVGKITYTIDNISAYGPEYFKKFANYDLVVVGCHGTPMGRLFVPSNPMSQGAFDEYNELSYTPGSGVWPGTHSLEVKSKINGKIVVDTITESGFFLGEKFFDKYLPDLTNTIIWTVKCYSAKPLAEFRNVCTSSIRKNAADYFGANWKCYGRDVYNIFDQYFVHLTQGRSSGEAFSKCFDNFGNKQNPIEKKLSNGTLYSRETTHFVHYLEAEATGVRKTANSRSTNAESEPVVVGVRFRYDVDENGQTKFNTQGGIRLVNLSSNSTIDIPITKDNILKQTPNIIDGNFIINDLDIQLTGLEPNTKYRYYAYIDADEEIISEESFEFETNGANHPPYYLWWLTCYGTYSNQMCVRYYSEDGNLADTITYSPDSGQYNPSIGLIKNTKNNKYALIFQPRLWFADEAVFLVELENDVKFDYIEEQLSTEYNGTIKSSVKNDILTMNVNIHFYNDKTEIISNNDFELYDWVKGELSQKFIVNLKDYIFDSTINSITTSRFRKNGYYGFTETDHKLYDFVYENSEFGEPQALSNIDVVNYWYPKIKIFCSPNF